MGKMSQNLSSGSVVIGALRVNISMIHVIITRHNAMLSIIVSEYDQGISQSQTADKPEVS